MSVWTYNFNTKSWAYSKYDQIVSIEDQDLGTGGVTIDELIGTIDELLGTIDDLSPSNLFVNTRMFGRVDGDIMFEDKMAETDAGREFITTIDSKSFVMPQLEQNIKEFKLELLINIGGEIKIYYSKNGGATDDSYYLVRTIAIGSLELSKPQIITIKRPQKCRKFAWRIVANAGQFDIINYELITSVSASSTTAENRV